MRFRPPPEEAMMLNSDGGLNRNVFPEPEMLVAVGTCAVRIVISPSSAGWRKLEVKFTVPSSGKWGKCDTLLLTLGAKGKKSTSWFDDFTMTEN